MEELVAKIAKIPIAQRVVFLAGAVAAIVLAAYFIWVSPIKTEIKKSENRIQQLDANLVKKRAIARDLTRYRVEVERLKQQLNEALTSLPNEAEIPELLQKIAALVEQSDCEMSTFEPQAELVERFYAKIPVKMAVNGNYHSIAVFFDKVSKLTRIVNVTDIMLEEPKVVNKKIMLDASFLATTFKFVEQKKPKGKGGRKGKPPAGKK